ncbi:MAG: RDD family protein [Endomicrobiales bacterium]|nr:RDD family protein [Endomicrobiales bacterium]
MEQFVSYPKADLTKRFLALVIDLAISFVLAAIPAVGWLVSFCYMAFRDGFELNFMRNRSLGKVAMKLKVAVVEGDRSAPNLAVSFKRNWMLAIPGISFIALIVEGIKVLNAPDGRRFGDNMAFTRVLDEKITGGSDVSNIIS